MDEGTSDDSGRTKFRWAGDVQAREAERRLVAANTVLAEDPHHPAALRDALAALLALGRDAEAEALYRRLVDATPADHELLSQFAEFLIRRQRWLPARNTALELTAQRPDDTRAWTLLAAAQQALGHISDARRSWDEVLAREPAQLDALRNRGQLLLVLREPEAAVADLSAAVGLDPDDAALKVDLARAQLAAVTPDKAVAVLHEVLETAPEHIPALNLLSELYLRRYELEPQYELESLETAIRLAERSISLDASQPAVQRRLETARAARQ